MLTRLKARMRTLRRFARAKRGSAAAEFAIVVVPFFLLTFGLAEIAMIGFAQTTLDFAVSNVARQIRTGEAQLGGRGRAAIEQELCTEVNRFLVLGCANNLYIDVRRFDSFVNAANNGNNAIQNGQFQPGGFNYQPGAASDIVVVRAYYRWKIMTPMFEPVFQNVAGGERIVASTMMFRNEPYQ